MRALFRDMFEDLDPFGRFWLILGLGSLAAAAAMSFDFGWGVSTKHAIFLAILTAVAAFGPMASEMLWGKGRKGASIATAVVCAPLLLIEFYSHAGYTAGLRGTNIETASVQNAKFDARKDAVSESKDLRATLMKERDDLKAQSPWSATVSADGLRASLAAAQKAIDLEEARGGCKSKCLARMKEKADLEDRIKTAEKMDTLTARIAALDKALAEKRDTAANTAFASSAVVHQNDFLAKVVALASNGSTKATDLQSATAEQSVNLAMAIAGTGLPAFALFMAGLFRLPRNREDEEHQPTHKPTFAGTTTLIAPDREIVRSQPTFRGTTLADLRRIAGAAA